MSRIQALVGKEFRDLARNRAALVPVGIVTLMALALPFAIAILVPYLTNQRLADDSDLVRVSTIAGARDGLSPEGQVQFFLFQQFLMLFLLTPVTGSMALASHAVIGEKQARTLEPLLATPVTTAELLVAKVIGALVPSLLISLAGVALYVSGIAIAAQPGVAAAMATARSALLVFLVGPAAALAALQAAIVVSSRVNDARTAQQFGVLLILPLTAVLVAQFTGSFWLSSAALVAIAGGLLVLWLALVVVSVALFDRETILTRWR